MRLVSYVQHVEQAVGDAESILDVGCGNNSPIGRFSRRPPHSVGVDLFEEWIEQSRKRGIHDEYRLLDALAIEDEFGPDAFDAVLACDVLEHLTAEDGALLLERMERVAHERVVVLTPNGYLEQGPNWGNPWQSHRSGWTADDFRERDYDVRGLNGFRFLRGGRGIVRLRPRCIFGRVAMATEPLVRTRPEQAFHLLCVKTF